MKSSMPGEFPDAPSPSPLRVVPVEASRAVRFVFEGRTIEAAPGETIGVALMASATLVLRTTERLGEGRGLFCNMGICFECLVEVDGRPNVRACQTVAQPGMRVQRQHGHGTSDAPVPT